MPPKSHRRCARAKCEAMGGSRRHVPRLWRDQGKRAEARDLLAPIYGWFAEGLDTPVLEEAKLLLEQLPASVMPVHVRPRTNL